MKVGDVHHSSKTVSVNMHDPITEQLECLTSMVYNMSIQKEENNRLFKPQIHQKKRGGQNRQNLVIEIEIDHTVETEIDKILGLTIGDNHKTDKYNMDVTVEEEVIDAKIMITEVTVEIEGDKLLEETLVMTDMTVETGIGVEQEKKSLTPRRNDRRHDSPSANLGTRNRSSSRVTTNRDRVRCYRCREYDHFANECPNTVADDSDGYESVRVALQLITAEPEMHNFDATRQNKEQDYLTL